MVKSEYEIVDSFQVGNICVLVLDSDYEYNKRFAKAIINGKLYSYTLNSIRNWVLLDIAGNFKGKKVKFVADKQ